MKFYYDVFAEVPLSRSDLEDLKEAAKRSSEANLLVGLLGQPDRETYRLERYYLTLLAKMVGEGPLKSRLLVALDEVLRESRLMNGHLEVGD